MKSISEEDRQRLRLLMADSQAALIKGVLNGELETLSDALLEIQDSEKSPEPFRSLLDLIEEARKLKDAPRASSSIPGLDKKLDGGFLAGHLIAVGAFTSGGKTTALVSQAVHSSELGHPTLYYTVECSACEIARKVDLSAGPKVNGIGPFLDIEDRKSDLEGIVSDIIRWVGSKKSEKIPIVCLDYVQRIRNLGATSREREVGEVAETLQRLARKKKIIILAAAQLNRQSKTEVEPSLTHFRESGLLEQTADIALLLWRPEETESRLNVKLGKNRWGGHVDEQINLDCDFAQSAFSPLSGLQKYADLADLVLSLFRKSKEKILTIRDVTQAIRWNKRHPKKIDLVACASACGGFSVSGADVIFIEQENVGNKMLANQLPTFANMPTCGTTLEAPDPKEGAESAVVGNVAHPVGVLAETLPTSKKKPKKYTMRKKGKKL